jgi:hypothetical protein
MNKLLDLRFVIGVFFLVIGGLLLVYSFVSEDESIRVTNRWCGVVFMVFGALMVFLSLKKDAHDEILEEDKSGNP